MVLIFDVAGCYVVFLSFAVLWLMLVWVAVCCCCCLLMLLLVVLAHVVVLAFVLLS